MIGSLRGKLIEKRPNLVLIDVGGVGYQVVVPLSTFTSLGALHSESTLLIYTRCMVFLPRGKNIASRC